MSIDLSKLLTLELALEHLIKAVSGEKLEYLAPGQTAPEDTKIHTTRRGARGYYPSEIVGGEEAAEAQGVAVARPELEPMGEREITGVTARDSSDVSEDVSEDSFTFEFERGPMTTTTEVNDYFGDVSIYLNAYLQRELGSDFKPYLSKDIELSLFTADHLQKAGYTDGSSEGLGYATGVGINNNVNFTVTIDDKPFIYKMVHGDNQAEVLAYTFDRALGLNIVPYVHLHSMDIEVLNDVVERTHGKPTIFKEEAPAISDSDIHVMSEEGRGSEAGGHFQEFCNNCLGREEAVSAITKMLMTEQGREEFFKVMLLDFITGNGDRHTGNYLITNDNKVVAIDNGLAGRGYQLMAHQAKKSLQPARETVGVEYMSFPYGLAKELRDKIGTKKVIKLSDMSTLMSEAENMFDKYFTQENKKILDTALNMSMWAIDVGEDQDFSKLKHAFATRAAQNLQMGIVGQGTGLSYELEPMEEGLDTPDFDWGKEYSV